jgi:hypothetical protein
MTVIELIEALIPYGDDAQVFLTVSIQGRELRYEQFAMRSHALGVECVANIGEEVTGICAQVVAQKVLNNPIFKDE